MQYVLGNMLNGGGGLNADGLALDLQFATDKTLTARKGPTPVFTRSSTGTYFGPLIDVAAEGTGWTTITIVNGRAQWTRIVAGVSRNLFYTGTRWKIEVAYPEDLYEYFAAEGSEWRPDQANWSESGISVTTSSTYGIVRAAINEPRFDHTSAGVCRGLLVEESRTNLTWPSAYTTADLGFGVFPSGSTTTTFNQLSSIGPSANGAALMLETATTQVHGGYAGTIRSSNPTAITIVSGTVYTASIYVKSSGRTRCRFSFNTSSNNDGIFAAFNLSGDGSITTNSTTYGSGASAAGLSASITKNADGWFRLTVSGSLTNTGGFLTVETLDDSGNRSYLGDVTKGLLITNGQLEAGSFATSYIPTTTGSVVRSADVCSITGANFTSFYNQPEGTIIGQGIVDTVGVGINFPYFANFNDGTANNRIVLGSTNSAGAGVRPIVAAAGSTVFSNSIGTSSAGQSRKVGMVYKQNDFIAAHNGTLTAADNTGNTPTAIDRVSFESNFFVGTIAAIRYYRKRLPNAKLVALTT
jgi:nucleoside diphosphate kinase